MTIVDFDELIHGLLGVYDQHMDGLHHTSNIVRMARSWPRPILYVQRYGRLTKGHLKGLHTLQEMGIEVEVEAIAPNYMGVRLSTAETLDPTYAAAAQGLHFLVRPFKNCDLAGVRGQHRE